MLIDILQQINEGRAEKGQGSKAGREKYTAPKEKKSSPVKARKSRVRIFDTIQDALKSSAPFGSIFSTKGADRLYVISRKKWGKDKQSQVGVRIAKGFTPGSATPSASWPSIKAHSIRTMLKHGGSKSKRLTAKYGAGKKRPEEKRYAGKKVKESIEALHEVLPLIPAALGAIRAVGLGARAAAKGVAKKAAKRVAATVPRAAVKTAQAAKRVATYQGDTAQQVSHTEYEGPSLREKLACIYEVVSPGVKAARKSSYVRGGTEHPEKVRKARADIGAGLGALAAKKAKAQSKASKDKLAKGRQGKKDRRLAREKERAERERGLHPYAPKRPPKLFRRVARKAIVGVGALATALKGAQAATVPTDQKVY
jgi:hypothetical protein